MRPLFFSQNACVLTRKRELFRRSTRTAADAERRTGGWRSRPGIGKGGEAYSGRKERNKLKTDGVRNKQGGAPCLLAHGRGSARGKERMSAGVDGHERGSRARAGGASCTKRERERDRAPSLPSVVDARRRWRCFFWSSKGSHHGFRCVVFSLQNARGGGCVIASVTRARWNRGSFVVFFFQGKAGGGGGPRRALDGKNRRKKSGSVLLLRPPPHSRLISRTPSLSTTLITYLLGATARRSRTSAIAFSITPTASSSDRSGLQSRSSRESAK